MVTRWWLFIDWYAWWQVYIYCVLKCCDMTELWRSMWRSINYIEFVADKGCALIMYFLPFVADRGCAPMTYVVENEVLMLHLRPSNSDWFRWLIDLVYEWNHVLMVKYGMIIQLILHTKYVILKWTCYESKSKVRYWYW